MNIFKKKEARTYGKLSQHELQLARGDKQSDKYKYKLVATIVKFRENGSTATRKPEVVKDSLTHLEALELQESEAKSHDAELHKGEIVYSILRDRRNETELQEYLASLRESGETQQLTRRIKELEQAGGTEMIATMKAMTARLEELELHANKQQERIVALSEGPTGDNAANQKAIEATVKAAEAKGRADAEADQLARDQAAAIIEAAETEAKQ